MKAFLHFLVKRQIKVATVKKFKLFNIVYVEPISELGKR